MISLKILKGESVFLLNGHDHDHVLYVGSLLFIVYYLKLLLNTKKKNK